MRHTTPIGILVCAAAGCAVLVPRVAGAGPSGRAYQLTHAVTADPSPAPDGRRMVYLSVVADREQLFVANLDGSRPIQLTHDDYDHEDPAWSPDGTKIAFVSKQGGLERIAMMDPDGTHVEVLTPRTVRTIHPNWSPDSSKLAYCTDDDLQPPKKNESEIDVIDRRTRQITKLISGGTNTYPSWSPDGKRLAFRRMLGALDSEVFIANADGSDIRNLTNHPAFDGWPSWSPDGSLIAFASNRHADRQHRGPRDRAGVVARRHGDLLLELPQRRLRARLRDLLRAAAARAAVVEGTSGEPAAAEACHSQ